MFYVDERRCRGAICAQRRDREAEEEHILCFFREHILCRLTTMPLRGGVRAQKRDREVGLYQDRACRTSHVTRVNESCHDWVC